MYFTAVTTMLGVRAHPLPPESLLQNYAAGGAYTDCYATGIALAVSHAAFVAAFYTTALFKAERLVLRIFASRPSSDAQARALALGELSSFAAWSAEARAANQLLVRDFTGRTRSWLMVEPLSPSSTRLLFGSAIVPRRDGRLGSGFTALMGFHKIYSQLLLAGARRRLALHP
jgi:hypothetical protein